MPIDRNDLLALAAAVGSGLMAGLFFAFSNFIMRALAALPPAQGIRAMQAINEYVLNSLFLTVFFGTASASAVLVVSAMADGDYLLLAASIVYLAGGFGVTAACNVPLNQRLARVDPDTAAGGALWTEYLRQWVRWNHVRTIATVSATVGFSAALLANG